MKGIALKVTFNDGGAARVGALGFNGACSNAMMEENVTSKSKGTYCKSDDSPCRPYVERGFQGDRPPDESCYESRLLRRSPWQFGGGMKHSGTRKGQWMRINGVEKGDIAFLTTVLPKTEGTERIIFGCFRVKEDPCLAGPDDIWENGYNVVSDGTMEVRLPDDVALRMPFWHFYRNPNAKDTLKWGSGLHRAISREQTENILQAMVAALGDRPERDVILKALGDKLTPRAVPLPVLPGDGFGLGGGESDDHRKLKNRIANNPELVGLPKDSKPFIDHAFLSGDHVDIKFDLPDGTWAVVEVETVSPLPGAHQCIKYKALLEAQESLPIGSRNVQSILAAHVITDEAEAFAKRYGIRTVRL